ncbi:MAG: helix-turn-helix transcriptional regulator [Patescibacteria group bacterium]
MPELTRTEKKVLKYAVKGVSSKEIADAMYVSKRTVDFHFSNIYQKLKVRNRAGALGKAFTLGIISVTTNS